MQLIIPMSGRGDRFLRAGYRMPKPLIPVDGKPMIEHVVNLFPGVEDVLFICNQEHLAETNLRTVLQGLRPAARIVGIPSHKLGPVHAVLQAADQIAEEDAVIVNYCDFACRWDFEQFRRTVREVGCDGGITAYRGFHPHSLGDTYYAYIREANHWLEEIREKAAFTKNRLQEYASAGTYYFAKGRYVTHYFRALMDRQVHVRGEYYVSLAYNLMKADGLRTYIYELEQFLQWGTPEDLEEYLEWRRIFQRWPAPHVSITVPGQTNLIPMAGEGRRFLEAGYTTPKPLISVDGMPMVQRAAECAPAGERWVFVCRADHLNHPRLADTLQQRWPQARVMSVARTTEGQACTCLLAEAEIPADQPLFIGACDNGMLWDAERFQSLIKDPRIDALIWTFQRHVGVRRHPQMYSYVEVAPDGMTARRVSMKTPLSEDPIHDHAVVGAFWFHRAGDFFQAARQLTARQDRTRGEFYVDACMNEVMRAGHRVGVFLLDHYIGWGTPDELNTYEYWDRYFSACAQLSR